LITAACIGLAAARRRVRDHHGQLQPETGVDDYDTSDRLYFEPLTLEEVLEVMAKEKPVGVIVQFGGQTPLKLSRALEKRVRRSSVRHPTPSTCRGSRALPGTREEAGFETAGQCDGPYRRPGRAPGARSGLSAGVRPSYVLGGRAMEVVFTEDDLRSYMTHAMKVSNDSPVLLDRFLDVAIEVDVDAVCDGEDVLIGGSWSTSSRAGVHSGDSGCSLPPNSLTPEVQAELREQTRKLARALNVVGLMNLQFAIQNGVIYVLEVNPRASRTVPFVFEGHWRRPGEDCGSGDDRPQAEGAGCHGRAGSRVLLGERGGVPLYQVPEADPILGPEMKSTEEVMGTGARTFGEAYAKAQAASGVTLPRNGVCFYQR